MKTWKKLATIFPDSAKLADPQSTTNENMERPVKNMADQYKSDVKRQNPSAA